MSGYTAFALAGMAVLAGWVLYAVRTENIPAHVARALAARNGFCEWADATLEVFADEDDAAFADRMRAVAAADAAEVQR